MSNKLNNEELAQFLDAQDEAMGIPKDSKDSWRAVEAGGCAPPVLVREAAAPSSSVIYLEEIKKLRNQVAILADERDNWKHRAIVAERNQEKRS